MSDSTLESFEDLLQRTYKQALNDILYSNEENVNGVLLKSSNLIEQRHKKTDFYRFQTNNSLEKANDDRVSQSPLKNEKPNKIRNKQLFFSGVLPFEKNENSFIRPHNKENFSSFFLKNKDDFILQKPIKTTQKKTLIEDEANL